MSHLEINIDFLVESIKTKDYMENIAHYLSRIKQEAAEARELISRIGTTGVGNADIIRQAKKWLGEK